MAHVDESKVPVTFRVDANGASTAALVADFADWERLPMERREGKRLEQWLLESGDHGPLSEDLVRGLCDGRPARSRTPRRARPSPRW